MLNGHLPASDSLGMELCCRDQSAGRNDSRRLSRQKDHGISPFLSLHPRPQPFPGLQVKMCGIHVLCVHVRVCMFSISITSVLISKLNQKAKLVFVPEDRDYVAHM